MVKVRRKNSRKKRNGKGHHKNRAKARKISASTVYETCTEQLSPFGGVLALVKFFDLVNFKEIFDFAYQKPTREPKLGNHLMMVGILMLLFIGFNRIWHFAYIRLDAMLCGFFRVTRLPAATTFWRYVDSLGINQAKSLLEVMSILRERIWQLCDIKLYQIRVNIDTTVETVYGNQQGARKGHNTKHRGKKGLRPILCFIEETREYLIGKLRKGTTVSGKETAAFILRIKEHLPGCVQAVLLRADGEFLSWESVEAAIAAGFRFIIANKGCSPPFDPGKWYRPFKRQDIEYNSCIYQPTGWGLACRFVAMRIPKERKKGSKQPIQCVLFEDDNYTYRIFCTDLSGKAHEVIAEYDKRADVENLVGEAKREGLEMIPSAKFKNNYAFFQIVMLAYNIWRYMKMIAHRSQSKDQSEPSGVLKGIVDNTIRIARLKLLFIAAKVVKDENRDKVKYSLHDARTPAMIHFLKFLDKVRSQPRPWHQAAFWPQRFVVTI
ncbi:MAG: IS1380 family transposase [Desulfobacterales bacterium]|nr:MAG: IS1380 family transposase [Desulfobacterales bacterium]